MAKSQVKLQRLQDDTAASADESNNEQTLQQVIKNALLYDSDTGAHDAYGMLGYDSQSYGLNLENKLAKLNALLDSLNDKKVSADGEESEENQRKESIEARPESKENNHLTIEKGHPKSG